MFYTNIVKLSPLWEIAQGRVLVQVDDALPLLMLYYFSKSAHKAQGNVFLWKMFSLQLALLPAGVQSR